MYRRNAESYVNIRRLIYCDHKGGINNVKKHEKLYEIFCTNSKYSKFYDKFPQRKFVIGDIRFVFRLRV